MKYKYLIKYMQFKPIDQSKIIMNIRKSILPIQPIRRYTTNVGKFLLPSH